MPLHLHPHEAIAHKVWHLEKVKPKNETAAVFFIRFYTDDIALRFYSAGQHLAAAVVDMLEISQQEFAPYEKKRVSRKVIVGNYLPKEKPIHPVTVVVLSLADSHEWAATVSL
jgi:hypothetical protein